MFDNIKLFIFALCFHGIRFKVNEDWVSGIDTLLFIYDIGRFLGFFFLKKRFALFFLSLLTFSLLG